GQQHRLRSCFHPGPPRNREAAARAHGRSDSCATRSGRGASDAMMDRRAFLRVVPSAAAACALPRFVRAGAARAPALSVTPLAERLFLIAGGGGNVVVFDSPEGVLMVDGGSPERSADVLRVVKERTG